MFLIITIPLTQSYYPLPDAFISTAQSTGILTLSTQDLEAEIRVICFQLL